MLRLYVFVTRTGQLFVAFMSNYYISKQYRASYSFSVTAEFLNFLAIIFSKLFDKNLKNTLKDIPCQQSLAKNACRSKRRLCWWSRTATVRFCQQIPGTRLLLGCETWEADSHQPVHGGQRIEPSLRTASCRAKCNNHISLMKLHKVHILTQPALLNLKTILTS